jgi:predicted esterase
MGHAVARCPKRLPILAAAAIVLSGAARAGAQEQQATGWYQRINQIHGADRREFYSIGRELAADPGEEALRALCRLWPFMNAALKQQVLKAWQFDDPEPSRVRFHPLAFKLFLASFPDWAPNTDAAEQATRYLSSYAWQSFASPDTAAIWLIEHANLPPEDAAIGSMQEWVARLRDARAPSIVASLMNDLAAIGNPLRRNTRVIAAARSQGMQRAIEAALEYPTVTWGACLNAYPLLTELDAQKYPGDGIGKFFEEYKDHAAPPEPAAERTGPPKGPDLRKVDNDDGKRWILHTPLGTSPPERGWGLLVVMPGDDGSEGFAPFVHDTIQHAAGPEYVVVQMIAPPLPAGAEPERAVVWPREQLKDPRVDFTMESVVNAAVDVVLTERVIDPQRVWMMGWASGGPPSYTMALEKGGMFRGAIVAMSAFPKEEYGSLEGAKRKSFYLLHSPTDPIPISQPESAKSTLGAAGARVKLETYEGGHGWHGDVAAQIREAVRWLEEKQ